MIPLQGRRARDMNLSFAGCGFLGIYHVGVAVCFKKYAPHLLLNKISGASAGAIAACALLCDLPLGERLPFQPGPSSRVGGRPLSQ